MDSRTPEKHTADEWEQAWREFYASFKRLRQMAENEHSDLTMNVKYKIGGLRPKL